MSKVVTKSIKMPDGAEITIETGKLAKQADGSVVVKMGNSMLLATVSELVKSTERRISCTASHRHKHCWLTRNRQFGNWDR